MADSTSSDSNASNADASSCCDCGCLPPDQTCDPPNDPHQPSDYSDDPVRYSNGEILLVETDLSFKSFGIDWGHTRSYGNRVTEPGTGRNGNSWFVKEWPYLVGMAFDPATPNLPQTVALTWVISETLWFDLNPEKQEYAARFYIRPKLRYDAPTDTFSITESNGRVTKFFGFASTTRETLRGQFLSYTDAAGRETLANYGADDLLESFVQNAAGQHTGYYYDYVASGGNAGKLHRVTYKVNGKPVRRAEYQYYGASEAHGNLGDLKKVTVSKLQGATWTALTNRYYRYYKPGHPNGVAHGLRFAVGPLGYRRMLEHHITPEIAKNDQVAAYATNQFSYLPDRSVIGEIVNSGTVTYGFTRTANAAPPPGEDFNAWVTKTLEERPDGTTRTVYTNFAGQAIFTAYTAFPPGATTEQHWYGWKQYDDAGRTLLEASSSAISGYDENQPDLAILRPDSGLIRGYEYYPGSNPGAGGAPNYKRYDFVQEGSAGARIKLKEWTYVRRRLGSQSVYAVASETTYRSAEGGGSEPATTTYSYRWQRFQIREKTTTYPVVTTSENGTGVAATLVEAYDPYGRLTWRKDERGYIDGYAYDPATDARIEEVRDVGDGAPWPVLPGPHLALRTDYEVDDEGRTTQELGPEHEIDVDGTATLIRRAAWTVYQDDLFQVWTARGYQRSSDGSYELINPVSIQARDDLNRLTDEIQAIRVSTVGRLQPDDQFPQDRWCRWFHSEYLYSPQVGARREYIDIPETGFGDRDVNYLETQFSYDVMQRQIAVVTPGGTINRMVLHPNGWILSEWIGTNDNGATETDPTGGGASDNNMTIIRANEYDNGAEGRDGNLTGETLYVSASVSRETSYGYDFRNRRLTAAGEVGFWQMYTLDNLDRIVREQQRVDDAAGVLVTQRETLFDSRGRVFRELDYRVGDDGTIGLPLKREKWYDPAGNLAAEQTAGVLACHKFVYDGVGRLVRDYLAAHGDGPVIESDGTVSNDTIVEQVEYSYDDGGNRIWELTRLRASDTTGDGPLNGPAGPAPVARENYRGTWSDAIGRTIALANYGTGGATAPTRPATIPSRSDDVLVSTYEINARGEIAASVDPAGLAEEFEMDDSGRTLRIVKREASSSTILSERRMTYTPDDLLATLVVTNSATGPQSTEWIYGVAQPGSDLNSNLLVSTKTVSGGAQTRYAYDRQGSVTQTTDQTGVVHALSYDGRGRLSIDSAQAVGSETDGAVRSVSIEYNARGLFAQVTNWSDPTPGAGAVVNQNRFTYDGFGQLAQEWQALTGSVDEASTPSVQYEHADGARNTARLLATTYPGGRVVTTNYGALNSLDDLLSRSASLADESTRVTYGYVGSDVLQRVEYPESGVQLDYAAGSSGGDPYPGWDCFGRVIKQRWSTAAADDLVYLQFTYDRAGSRLTRRDVVAGTGGDEGYAYDSLAQLTELKRGTLNSSGSGFTGTIRWQEAFDYDPAGNWQRYRTWIDGTADLDQTREHAVTNEITSLSTSPGLAEYDLAGEMVVSPQTGDWAAGYEMTYDAWRRLASVAVGGSTPSPLASYTYDGLGRRIRILAAGVDAVNQYYSTNWQVLEQRIGTSSDAAAQFIWGVRGIDDLVLRERADGSSPERLYALNDTLSVVAIADSGGEVVERYQYSGFGTPSFLEADFTPTTASTHQWETLFASYPWDAETGLYHVRHRVLHSPLGRWLTLDPETGNEEEGDNLYAYVYNRPTVNDDPLGLGFFDFFKLTNPGGITLVMLKFIYNGNKCKAGDYKGRNYKLPCSIWCICKKNNRGYWAHGKGQIRVYFKCHVVAAGRGYWEGDKMEVTTPCSVGCAAEYDAPYGIHYDFIPPLTVN